MTVAAWYELQGTIILPGLLLLIAIVMLLDFFLAWKKR